MGHLFISYSHKDSLYVHQLAETLEKEGFNVWIDDRIHYGSEWPKVVTRNLDISDGVIIVLSYNSYESDMVQNEVTRAREKRKPIFPLLLEGENWLIVQAKQFVDVRDGSLPTEKFYRRLEEVTPRKNERAEREAAERTAYEKAKREAVEKAEHERAEKAERDRLAREAAEKSRREKIEREAREKAAKEQLKRENVDLARRERAKYLAAQKTEITRVLTESVTALRSGFPKIFRSLKIIGYAGIIIGLFWLISWATHKLIPFIPTPPPITTLPIDVITYTKSALPITNTLPSHITPTKPITVTPVPAKTLVSTKVPTATAYNGPLSAEITDSRGVKMILIPAGDFVMGSDNGEMDEKPEHTVYLDSFYIDKYEVTNRLHQLCVSAGGCQLPDHFNYAFFDAFRFINDFGTSSYYGNHKFDNYPMIYLNWSYAENYCAWRSAQLPTEAQWEKAARGTDEHNYPWGENIDKTYANYDSIIGHTTAVGSYESGKSPYDVYDMAGNVWEWVKDWYSETYYSNSPSINPQGPDTGQLRILRGGSWSLYGGYGVRTFFRLKSNPSNFNDSIGFRCALSVKP